MRVALPGPTRMGGPAAVLPQQISASLATPRYARRLPLYDGTNLAAAVARGDGRLTPSPARRRNQVGVRFLEYESFSILQLVITRQGAKDSYFSRFRVPNSGLMVFITGT
jgi:hypothetical protein